MAIHCMLLTGDNKIIVQNFFNEFKDKYACMSNPKLVQAMISAWQSANFKDGEEPTMPTKDEIEKFIQSQIGSRQSSETPVRSTNIADYVNTEGKDKGFLTKKGEELLSTTFDKSKFNKGTNKVSIYPGVNGTEIRIDWTSPRTGNSASVIYYGSSTRKVWDLFNSKGGNVTNVTSDIYWDALNKIIPNSLRELVESGKYNELDTTAIETDTKTLIVKKTALEDYFEKEYNVFKQGRSLDYNTKQINKALSPVQDTTEKQDITSTQEEAPIQEDNKSYAEDLARCARQMSPIERKHRVERITRMFSSIVNDKLKEKLAAYNDKINAETNPKVKNDLLFGRKKITRFSVIKSEGVQSIMMEVRTAFQVYVDAPLEAKIEFEKQQILAAKSNLSDKIVTNIARKVVERKDTAFKNVLNNFQVLAEESLGNLALTEGISVNLNSNFVLNTQENSDTFNEDGKQTNQGDVFEKEESLKDGWMTDVRQVATFDSLTARVRQAIGNMVRYDSTGNVDRDDLGDNIYLNAGYVHSELIQALRNMISAEDMIPMLEQLSKKKVWVRQIINELNNDNQLFTEFYRAYRKDYVNYFIQKVSTNGDTSTSTKVMSINGAEGTSHYFDEWRDNYEYGNVLTTDSIYDKNGDIQLKNAKVGLDLVDSLLDIFEERETIAENLTDENIARIKKAMNMLGASVDSETLENALKFNLDNKAFKPAVNVLLSNLRTIYYDLNKGNEKVKDGEYVDLLNIHGTAFNNIAEVINKVDEDTIESSVRQGDKTMYAHINPSYVTTLIKKLQREDTYKQVLDDYRVCNWFNKNGKWRNSILEEIENNAEVRSNLKHVVLLQYNRKEYNAWTDLDATLALYNMYMTGAADRSGSETYGYYQVPMLSDAQSAEFIKFKRYKKGYEEKLLDKFKDLVYQEIDRINLVKERATTDNHIDPIANFDMNGKKMGGAEFKFFPELNQKDENGKTFLQQIDEAK